MTVAETLLVFVGIPLLTFAILASLVFGPSLLHQPNRYRPGRAWNYAPRWYIAHPKALGRTPSSAGSSAVGGASGEW